MLCAWSGRILFPSLPPPPFPAHAHHEEKYGWLARLNARLLHAMVLHNRIRIQRLPYFLIVRDQLKGAGVRESGAMRILWPLS